jgi:type I restriction enzyme S subunit
MNYDKNNIPSLRFPEFKYDWEKKKLGEVAEIGRGKSKHRPRNAKFLYGGEYPFIQTGDIRNAELYLDTYSHTYSEAGLKQSKLWNENTLCITIAANIAETTILKIKACFPDSIIGLIPKENETIVLFVKNLFDKFKIEIQSLSQGVAQANLNQEKLSNIEFSFPTLAEQTKIANLFTAIDDKLQSLKKKKHLLEQYKKGAMQQLFSGKLRFKDENGEDYADWEMKKLGEVARITTGSSNRQDSNLDGKYTFFDRSQDIRTSDRFLFDAEAIIVPGEGQEFIPKYFRGKFDLHQRTYAIMDFNGINGTFLFYSISFNTNHLDSHAVGSTVKSLRLPMFETMPINFPCLEEQTKIANFLSSLDEKINSTNNQITKTQEWKKGLLQQMFV